MFFLFLFSCQYCLLFILAYYYSAWTFEDVEFYLHPSVFISQMIFIHLLSFYSAYPLIFIMIGLPFILLYLMLTTLLKVPVFWGVILILTRRAVPCFAGCLSYVATVQPQDVLTSVIMRMRSPVFLISIVASFVSDLLNLPKSMLVRLASATVPTVFLSELSFPVISFRYRSFNAGLFTGLPNTNTLFPSFSKNV